MEAITRLEKSGMSISEIAAAACVGPHAVRRWKRHECAPTSTTRKRLTTLAESRGLVLLATDFDLPTAPAAESEAA